MQTVMVTISTIGAVTVEAQGFQGSGCAEATGRIRQALGGKTDKDEKKPEFYASVSGTTHNRTF